VATRVVVGGVLLSRDELLGVVELAAGAGADLVDDGRLEVNEQGAGHVCFPEPVSENKVLKASSPPRADGLVRGHLAVGLDAVLEAVKFPARVTALDTGLAHVDRYNLAHLEVKAVVWFEERCAKCLARDLRIRDPKGLSLLLCISDGAARGRKYARAAAELRCRGPNLFATPRPDLQRARVGANRAL